MDNDVMLDSKPGLLMLGNYHLGKGKYGAPSSEIGERLKQRGYRVFRSSFRRWRLPNFVDKLYSTVRFRHKYDIALVDVYSGLAFFWAEAVCWALRCVGKPYILTLRGGNLPAFARRWPKRIQHLLRSASVVTSPSRYLQTEMKPYRENIIVIPNAIDPERYDYRVRHNPMPQLVWLRAFHEIYNPSLAPKVIALLAEDFPQVHLTMFGPDKGDGSLQRCQKTASDLGVADRIAFPGAVPKEQVSQHLNTGDVFINTTNVDNTPVSLIEALACGLCAVTTNVGGIPYLVQHERDVLLVPPNDPNAMAEAVRRVLTEPQLAIQLSETASKFTQSFHWNAVLPQWENVITAAFRKSIKKKP